MGGSFQIENFISDKMMFSLGHCSVEWVILKTHHAHLRCFSLAFRFLQDVAPCWLSMCLCLGEGDRAPSGLPVRHPHSHCATWDRSLDDRLYLFTLRLVFRQGTQVIPLHQSHPWSLSLSLNSCTSGHLVSQLRRAGLSFFLFLWLLIVCKSFTHDDQFPKGRCHSLYLLCSL